MMPLSCGASCGCKVTASAVNQSTQQILMCCIVTFRHLLIVCQLFLDEFVVLSTHNCRHWNGDPLTLRFEGIALARTIWRESRTSLSGRDRPVAIAVGSTNVHRVCEDPSHTRVCPACFPARALDPCGLQLLDNAIDAAAWFKIPGVNLLDNDSFIRVNLHTSWVARSFGVELIAKRTACPGKGSCSVYRKAKPISGFMCCCRCCGQPFASWETRRAARSRIWPSASACQRARLQPNPAMLPADLHSSQDQSMRFALTCQTASGNHSRVILLERMLLESRTVAST
jgi:hypothetical protein